MLSVLSSSLPVPLAGMGHMYGQRPFPNGIFEESLLQFGLGLPFGWGIGNLRHKRPNPNGPRRTPALKIFKTERKYVVKEVSSKIQIFL